MTILILNFFILMQNRSRVFTPRQYKKYIKYVNIGINKLYSQIYN